MITRRTLLGGSVAIAALATVPALARPKEVLEVEIDRPEGIHGEWRVVGGILADRLPAHQTVVGFVSYPGLTRYRIRTSDGWRDWVSIESPDYRLITLQRYV